MLNHQWPLLGSQVKCAASRQACLAGSATGPTLLTCADLGVDAPSIIAAMTSSLGRPRASAALCDRNSCIRHPVATMALSSIVSVPCSSWTLAVGVIPGCADGSFDGATEAKARPCRTFKIVVDLAQIITSAGMRRVLSLPRWRGLLAEGSRYLGKDLHPRLPLPAQGELLSPGKLLNPTQAPCCTELLSLQHLKAGHT